MVQNELLGGTARILHEVLSERLGLYFQSLRHDYDIGLVEIVIFYAVRSDVHLSLTVLETLEPRTGRRLTHIGTG